jgi:hypothetical protein
MTSLTTKMTSSKLRVLSLGDPKYVGKDYLEEFKKGFDFDVSCSFLHQQGIMPLISIGPPICK